MARPIRPGGGGGYGPGPSAGGARWSRSSGVTGTPKKTPKATSTVKPPSGKTWSSKSGVKTTSPSPASTSKASQQSKSAGKKPTRADLKSPIPNKKRIAAGGSAAVAVGLAFAAKNKRDAAERIRKGKRVGQ